MQDCTSIPCTPRNIRATLSPRDYSASACMQNLGNRIVSGAGAKKVSGLKAGPGLEAGRTRSTSPHYVRTAGSRPLLLAAQRFREGWFVLIVE